MLIGTVILIIGKAEIYGENAFSLLVFFRWYGTLIENVKLNLMKIVKWLACEYLFYLHYKLHQFI